VSIWVCGEVLIDLLPGNPDRIPVVGGGPANTAKALSRLGHDVQFIDGISTDAYGVSARAELEHDEVKLDLALTSDKPTCLAIVSVGENGGATYEFKIEGTATFDFSLDWLPDPSIHKPSILHIGTLVTIIEPGASVLYDWAMRVAEFAPIVFDPNVRTSVMNDREKYCAVVEKWVAIATTVKVADDELKWLYPDEDIEEVCKRWVRDGAALVVMTRGANGSKGFTASGSEEAAGVKVDVIDTVGAGDTVGAIVVEAMIEDGVMALEGENLRKVLERSAQAAGITCSRKGAQPPYKHELPKRK
jgi:fructokinase